MRAVDGGVVRLRDARGLKGRLVDVAEGVERCARVRVAGVAPRAEVGGEELLAGGDVVLADQVLDGRVGGAGSDGVDGAKGEAKKAVADAGGELSGQGLGQLDRLVFDGEAADGDIVGANSARGGRAVSVGDLPRSTLGGFVGARVFGVVDRVVVTSRCDGSFGEFGGEDLPPKLARLK